MKLQWTGFSHQFKAQGDTHHYAVTQGRVVPEGTMFRTSQWRNGQIVRQLDVVGLEGAFARAQVWENGS